MRLYSNETFGQQALEKVTDTDLKIKAFCK